MENNNIIVVDESEKISKLEWDIFIKNIKQIGI